MPGETHDRRSHSERQLIAEVFGEAYGLSGSNGSLPQVQWRDLEAGEVLFEAGDPSDSIFVIASGRLVAEVSHDGHVHRRSMSRGATVGEVGFLAGAPRSATVRAARPTTVGLLPRDQLLEVVARRPDVAIDLARTALERSHGRGDQGSTTWLAVVALDDATHDLARQLVRALDDTTSVAHIEVNADTPETPADDDLARLEAAHDVLVRSHGPGIGERTRSSLGSADRVLFTAQAPLSSTARARLDALLADHSVDNAAAGRLTGSWLVLRHRHETRQPTGSADVRRRFGDRIDEIHHIRADRPDDIARLGRLATGRGVAVVLSGGGARGYGHLGAWRAYHELGLVADKIGGVSMGAPIGGGLALGTSLDEMVPVCERQFHRLLDYTLPIHSLLRGRRITRSLRDFFGELDIEDLWLPFFCVSSNLTSGETVVHRRGDAVTAIRASSAIPGVLPPVPHDGDLLVDGGVLDNMPIGPFADDRSIGEIVAFDAVPTRGPQARTDFGLDVSGWRRAADVLPGRRAKIPGIGNVILRSMILGSVNKRNDYEARRVADLIVRMDLDGVAMLDFERVAEVAALGYDNAHHQLADYAARHTAG